MTPEQLSERHRAQVRSMILEEEQRKAQRRQEDRERVLAMIVAAYLRPRVQGGLDACLAAFRQLHQEALELDADPVRARTEELLALEAELRLAGLVCPEVPGSAHALHAFRKLHTEAHEEDRARQLADPRYEPGRSD